MDALEELRLAGRIGALVRMEASELREFVATATGATPLAQKAAIAHVQLVKVRLDDAEEALSDWLVQRGHDKRPDESRVGQLLTQADAHGAALVLIELANFLYRRLQYEEGLKVISYLDACIQRMVVGIPSRRLVQAERTVAKVRLGWRAGQREEIDRELREEELCLRESYTVDNAGAFGGFDSALALVLDLQAATQWRAGNLDTARLKVYEAIALLQTGRADDPVRLAVLRNRAATIEASKSNNDFTWATRWTHEAEELFRQLAHPFVWRPVLQRAQCQIKAGELDRATGTLNELLLTIPKSGPEGQYADAELWLSRTWIAQRRAEREPQLIGDWLSTAKKVCRNSDIPPRLKAEGELQIGLALVARARAEDVHTSRAHIDEALRISSRNGRKNTQIACLFGLAEGLLIEGDIVAAAEKWEDASKLLSTTGSSYLSAWAERLGPRVHGRTLVSLEGPWRKKVEPALKRMYLQYHLQKAQMDPAGAMKETGLSKATFYRLCRDAGIAPPQRRGGSRRTKSASGADSTATD